MQLPNNSLVIKERRAQAIKRRRKLRDLVGNEFTINELVIASGLTEGVVRKQVNLMVDRKEVEPTSLYRTPRTFRKTQPSHE